MRTHLFFLATLALASLSFTHPAAANDASVDLTISGGSLQPTQNSVDQRIPGVGSLTAKQGAANGVGGRVSIWLNHHFALEGTGFYVGKSALEAQAFGATGAVDVSLFYGSGRVACGIGDRTRLLLSAGIATMARNFDTPLIEDGSLTVGVVGAGLMIPVGNAVSVRLDLDDYLYNTYWEFAGVRTDELPQHDLVFSAGLTFHTGR
ncbi:MAG: hypothetical protein U0167_15125 [bacterium]